MKFYTENFVNIRKARGYSIQKLAEAINVNRASIWAWESGRRVPKEKSIIALSEKLDICVSEISDMKPVKRLLPVNFSSSLRGLSGIKEKRQSQVIRKLRENIDLLDIEFSKTGIILDSLMDAIDILFYLKDTEGKFVIANKAFLRQLRLNENYNIYGKNDNDLFALKEAEFNSKEDYDVLISGKTLRREGYIPGTRKKRWGLFSRIPLIEKNECVSGLIVTIADITDRKKEEQRRLLLESALDNIDDGVWVSQIGDIGNKDCNIKYLNKIFEDWTGYSREYAYKNQNFWKEFLNRREIRKHEKKLLQKKDSWQTRNIEIKTKSGEILSASEKVFSFENMLIGIIRDHTQENKLIKTNDVLMNLVDIADEIVWYSDVSNNQYVSKLDFVNDSVYSIAGIKSDNLKNDYRLWRNIVHIDDREKYYSWVNSDIFPKEMSYRIIHQNTKKIVWVKAKTYQVNNIRYGIIKDISTERSKEHEFEQISLYKDILFDYIDTPSTGYWIQEISPENRLLYISKGYQKILGIDSKLLYKESQLWKTCVNPDNLNELENHKIPEFNERIIIRYLVKNQLTMMETKVENQIVLINKGDKLVIGGFINVIGC